MVVCKEDIIAVFIVQAEIIIGIVMMTIVNYYALDNTHLMLEMKMLFSLCILTTKRLSALVLFQISDTVRSYKLEVGGCCSSGGWGRGRGP